MFIINNKAFFNLTLADYIKQVYDPKSVTANEFIRDYLTYHQYEHWVNNFAYRDQPFFTFKIVVIFLDHDGLYKEVSCQKEEGFASLRLCQKQAYNTFIEECKLNISHFNFAHLYFTTYEKPPLNQAFNDFIFAPLKLIEQNSEVTELSCMAIACYFDGKDYQILTIENDNEQIDFPKGHLEVGETPVECAIRECFEETQVVIQPEDYLCELSDYHYAFYAGTMRMENLAFYQTFKAVKVNKHIKVFAFLVKERKEPIPQREERLIDSKWIPLNDITNYLAFENGKQLINELKPKLPNKAS